MADDAKIASLEEQIADLNDTIEMLTLDKEQLSIEKELAEENLRRLQEVADSKSGGAASTDTASAELVAENDKLRNALQRLHELSKAEKESASIEIGQLEERLANFEKIEKENRELGISLDGAKAELAELRQAVDASASYESMIENLTEQNLELTNRIQTMDSSSREAESAQELMEELDARQRQEINRLVKELDIAVVGKQNADLEIISLKDKCNESKRNEEKFRRIIDSLQQEEKRLKNEIGEMNERTSAVTQRTKEASDIKVTQVALVQQISVLQQHVRKLEHQCHEAKASFRRVGAIFGSSSVYMNEMPSLSQEVRLVSAGSLGTLLCSADHELLTKSTDSMMTSSSSEADQKLDPEALAALHARYPIFLRSTCVLWEAAAVALYGVEEGSDIGEGPPSPSKGKSPTKQRAVVDASNELATAVTSLVTSSGLPDQLNMCLSDMQQISSLSLSRMETSANQLQRQLLALVDKYGIPLEDCSPTVEWTSPKIVEENNYLPVILAGIQISYMAHLLTHQASDLILSGLMDKSKGLSGDLITVWSLLSSELASMNDFAECVVGSSEVPLEQKLSLLVGIRNTIARTFSELSPLDANKESIFSTELLKNAIARLRETMIGVRNISKINPDTSTLESRGQPHKLDVAKSSDILWSWIYSESTNAELSRSPAMWHRRAAQLRAKVTDWDSSDAVRKDLQTRLQRAEQSVGMKEDELKSALRRCSELETLSKVQAHAQTQGPQASSKSNDGRGKTQVPGKDTDAATRRETSTSDGALMEENKILTEAIEVLEKRYAAAEKEIKAIKSGRPAPSSTTTTPMKGLGESPLSPVGKGPATGLSFGGAGEAMSAESAAFLQSEMKHWRKLACTRMMDSLSPLPMPQCLLSAPPGVHPEGTTSTSDITLSSPKQSIDNTLKSDPASRKANARRVYQDIRRIRASIRVCDISSGSVGGIAGKRYGLTSKRKASYSLLTHQTKDVNIRTLDDFAKALM